MEKSSEEQVRSKALPSCVHDPSGAKETARRLFELEISGRGGYQLGDARFESFWVPCVVGQAGEWPVVHEPAVA